MPTTTVTVTGLKELEAELNAFPDKVDKLILKKATRAGMVVFLNGMRARVPVMVPSHWTMSLRDTLTIKLKHSTTAGEFIGTLGSFKAGKGGVPKNLALWVELGTKPHEIEARPGKALAFGGTMVKSLQHPGAQPRPFMRPTFEAEKGRALDAFADALRKWIGKYEVKFLKKGHY